MPCVAYRYGKKTPVLLSTVVKLYSTVHKQNKGDKELLCVVADYNNVMGGVGLKDTKLYTYLGGKESTQVDNQGCFFSVWYIYTQ